MKPSGDTKRCGRCKADKPLADFGKRGAGRDGYQAWCRQCFRDNERIRRREKAGLPVDTPLRRGARPSAPVGTTCQHSTRGYVVVKTDGHHRADKYGWVMQHIVIAEEKYGIRITRDFTVHHINGDRADNRPENLELRWGNHGKGADVLPGLLRSPEMREIAREILRQYDDD